MAQFDGIFNMAQPFGNGVRACIGRPFAWQEALLAVSTLLQTFHFTKEPPSYQLRIRTTLTIKPEGFYMKAKLRDNHYLETLDLGPHNVPEKHAVQPSSTSHSDSGSLLQILYGSNTGTCEALARGLASSATTHGFRPEVKSMDSAVSQLSKNSPIIIITASYEGNPPDNAVHFIEWLTEAAEGEVSQLPYAVFGVGNSTLITNK